MLEQFFECAGSAALGSNLTPDMTGRDAQEREANAHEKVDTRRKS
jgi:hypothetical protein